MPEIERDRIAQCFLRAVVCQADDLRVEKTIRARGSPRLVRRQVLVGVCVARVDEVVVQIERQAHQPVLPSRREHLVDRHRDLRLAGRRIHAGNALAGALRHPQHVVRAPRHFVRPGESRHDLALAELLRPAHDSLGPILRDQAHKYDQAAHDGGNKFSHSVSNGSRYYRILRFAALYEGKSATGPAHGCEERAVSSAKAEPYEES